MAVGRYKYPSNSSLDQILQGGVDVGKGHSPVRRDQEIAVRVSNGHDRSKTDDFFCS